MRRRGDRIRRFYAHDVEDSASSTSPGLQLSSDLQSLWLDTYPPLSSLSLPPTVTTLILSNLCPLPPSIFSPRLPPLLAVLQITLAPYWPDGKISILTTPLDLSHLQHLTSLILNGGEETSNLVSPELFQTLRNAEAINCIRVWYCVVDWAFTGFVFPEFIRWFFGDRGVNQEEDTVDGAEGRELSVELFFGGWLEEQIFEARSTLKEFGVSEEDKYTWVLESGEW
ncbi:hypothetical protein BT69DRAFT_1276047 [Atractiella rhizophila]|nr:hypothetical protein BT69DRAFT_1276047 [Atractiella rhizophila]